MKRQRQFSSSMKVVILCAVVLAAFVVAGFMNSRMAGKFYGSDERSATELEPQWYPPERITQYPEPSQSPIDEARKAEEERIRLERERASQEYAEKTEQEWVAALSSEWKTYRDDKLGLQFSYPAGFGEWKLYRDDDFQYIWTYGDGSGVSLNYNATPPAVQHEASFCGDGSTGWKKIRQADGSTHLILFVGKDDWDTVSNGMNTKISSFNSRIVRIEGSDGAFCDWGVNFSMNLLGKAYPGVSLNTGYFSSATVKMVAERIEKSIVIYQPK